MTAQEAEARTTALFEELRDTIARPPLPLVDAAASLRVRVMRDDLDTVDRTRTVDLPLDAVDPLVEWIRERLRPGDAVRVEWLDGTGSPLPLSGARGRFTLPKDRPMADRPTVVDVASSPSSTAPSSTAPSSLVPSSAAPLVAAAEALAHAPQHVEGHERLLVAGLGHGASGMALAERLVFAALATADRQAAANERIAAILGTALAAVAGSNARMVEAAHAPSKPLAEALVAAAEGQAGLVGLLLGRGDAAHDALVEARVAEERARAAPRLDAEGNPLPVEGDGTATIKALAEVLREGKSLVQGSAEEAVAGMLAKVAEGGKVPPKVAKVLDGLTVEQKVALGQAIAAALVPK